jgi:spore coat polysaccharide biosynthesis protein SpsF (cytidylyltransferase family)/aryl-alcohol dehydrogenase-like predicted oxidoreductase
MRSITIIQARTTSSRLPGKALLPIREYPTAVLAALRAANLRDEVRVATSTDSSDDALADILRKYKLITVRGSLQDVLARYVAAAADLSDDDVVVRLTADNVVPDGTLVRELVESFSASGLEYLCANSTRGPLPYGLGGEVFTVAALRKAHRSATSAYDREHVCPWMSRNCRSGIYVPQSLRGADYGHLRCTIDDEEDYNRIVHLFAAVADPVKVGWRELMVNLAVSPNEPRFRVPFKVIDGKLHSQMTLGTVQLGMEYGAANRTGKPAKATAVAMVRSAVAHGVAALDTARTYGESEAVIGEALTGAWRSRVQVVTKLDTLKTMSSGASDASIQAAVDASIDRSCEALGTEKLQTLLLHDWAHYPRWNGAVWRRLVELRDRGRIENLGASVYEPHEALVALRDMDLKHLQIPMNVLDWRWKAEGVDRAIGDRPDVIVHARSSLLQGLLAMNAESWPAVGSFDTSDCVERLRDAARDFHRASVVDLCLAYVRSQSWITSVVVGCETMEQLSENLGLFRLPALTAEEAEELEQRLLKAPDTLLNPSKWPTAVGNRK